MKLYPSERGLDLRIIAYGASRRRMSVGVVDESTFRPRALGDTACKNASPRPFCFANPTSYQTALPRDIEVFSAIWEMVPVTGIEPVRYKVSRDFKSRASASSATPAKPNKTLFFGSHCSFYHREGGLSTPFRQNLFDAFRRRLPIKTQGDRQNRPCNSPNRCRSSRRGCGQIRAFRRRKCCGRCTC